MSLASSRDVFQTGWLERRSAAGWEKRFGVVKGPTFFLFTKKIQHNRLGDAAFLQENATDIFGPLASMKVESCVIGFKSTCFKLLGGGDDSYSFSVGTVTEQQDWIDALSVELPGSSDSKSDTSGDSFDISNDSSSQSEDERDVISNESGEQNPPQSASEPTTPTSAAADGVQVPGSFESSSDTDEECLGAEVPVWKKQLSGLPKEWKAALKEANIRKADLKDDTVRSAMFAIMKAQDASGRKIDAHTLTSVMSMSTDRARATSGGSHSKKEKAWARTSNFKRRIGIGLGKSSKPSALDQHLADLVVNERTGTAALFKEKVDASWATKKNVLYDWANVEDDAAICAVSKLQETENTAAEKLEVEGPPEWTDDDKAEIRAIARHIDVSARSIGYHFECGARKIMYPVPATVVQRDRDMWAYRDFFYGKPHHNYVAELPDEEKHPEAFREFVPACLSIETPSKSSDRRAILRMIGGNERFIIPWAYAGSTTEMINYVRLVKPELPERLMEVKEPLEGSSLPSLSDTLAKYEKQELDLRLKFKFGVLYAADGQNDENVMFSNRAEDSSEAYDEFLTLLGEKVVLEGFQKYRGGLDVKGTNATGTHSIYHCIDDTYEIMFHVATMLPFQEDDIQRVERKRHLGNDVVCIVFREGGVPFNPSWLTNQFNHIFCVVALDHRNDDNAPVYRIAFGNRDGVMPYGPFLEYKPLLVKGEELRDLLLCKLVNAERSCMDFTPTFKNKLQRTRKELLTDMAKSFTRAALAQAEREKRAREKERARREREEQKLAQRVGRPDSMGRPDSLGTISPTQTIRHVQMEDGVEVSSASEAHEHSDVEEASLNAASQVGHVITVSSEPSRRRTGSVGLSHSSSVVLDAGGSDKKATLRNRLLSVRTKKVFNSHIDTPTAAKTVSPEQPVDLRPSAESALVDAHLLLQEWAKSLWSDEQDSSPAISSGDVVLALNIINRFVQQVMQPLVDSTSDERVDSIDRAAATAEVGCAFVQALQAYVADDSESTAAISKMKQAREDLFKMANHVVSISRRNSVGHVDDKALSEEGSGQVADDPPKPAEEANTSSPEKGATDNRIIAEVASANSSLASESPAADASLKRDTTSITTEAAPLENATALPPLRRSKSEKKVSALAKLRNRTSMKSTAEAVEDSQGLAWRESMSDEANRIKSYKEGSSFTLKLKWPHVTPTAVAMAEAGLYFNPLKKKKDRATCYACNAHFHSWAVQDDPRIEHVRVRPNCSLVAKYNLASSKITFTPTLSEYKQRLGGDDKTSTSETSTKQAATTSATAKTARKETPTTLAAESKADKGPISENVLPLESMDIGQLICAAEQASEQVKVALDTELVVLGEVTGAIRKMGQIARHAVMKIGSDLTSDQVQDINEGAQLLLLLARKITGATDGDATSKVSSSDRDALRDAIASFVDSIHVRT